MGVGTTEIDLGNLTKFLFRAKINTWAGDGKSWTEPDGAKKHVFGDKYVVEGNSMYPALKYEDEYRGYSNQAVNHAGAGRELVSLKAITPTWQMNYFGFITQYGEMCETDEQKCAFAEQVFGVLKEALRNAPRELPLRGPPKFKSEGWTYKCIVEGDIAAFAGREEISTWPEIAPQTPPGFALGTVFVQYFHGGLILPKTKR
jgi:hypothetical protein